ncbi:MAG: hypothetical protein KDK41_12495 [Leptospiraceae bacterium]|nr:hypothetical protein [Leptospiraceae bacterium]
MKFNAFIGFTAGLLFISCTSNFDENNRNKDIFDEAKTLSQVSYTGTNYDFDGGISALRSYIMSTSPENVPVNTINPPALTAYSTTIEGIVTVPSSADFLLDNNDTCNEIYKLYNRSFILQDQNSAILVLYGREPALFTGSPTSMEYVSNANRANMAVLGNRLRITVTQVIRHGIDPGNQIPLVVDFSNPTIISKTNSVFFTNQSSTFTRGTDLYMNRRIEGIVNVTPSYSECASGSGRDFQLQHEVAYIGRICVGGTGAMTTWVNSSNACVNGSTEFKFRLSKNLAQGTLSTFNVGTDFSYTLAKGAMVRMTGPVFIPNRGGADSDLMILLDQKSQVENLQ